MLFDFMKHFKKKEANISLYGRDLNIWNYLGFSTLKYTNSEIACDIHFFVLKGNDKIRDYYLDTRYPSNFKDHNWMTNAHLWKANEIGLKYAIATWPSAYMKSISKKDGYDWNYDKKEWIPSSITEGNIVSVDFKKK